MSRRREKPSAVHTFGDMQADWQAGKRSRHLRERRNVTGQGDAQYANLPEFERIRDYVRDMDRNESIVGPFVDRAVQNQIQTGFRFQPETGDKGLDDDLKARFNEWAEDPHQCDLAGTRTLWQQSHGWLRQTYIDGDIVTLLTQDGAVQTLEADRLRSPSGDPEDIVHGIQLDKLRRKVAYWFGEDSGKSRNRRGQTHRHDAFDDDGFPAILHVTNPNTLRQFTQTRGVSAFAPVFYRLSMIEDTQFATLLQRQLVSQIAFFWERTADYQGGGATMGRAETGPAIAGDQGDSNIEKVAPGMSLRGVKGEKLQAISANVPNPEYMPYIRMLLLEVGINIGVPLVLALMDARETNFSGFRGAVDAARMGFRINQKWHIDTTLRPLYQWKVRQWRELPASAGGLGHAARINPDLLSVRCTAPTWPYIQPFEDTKANELRMLTMQLSPGQFMREQGGEWDEQVDETVGNWEYAIVAAKTKAAAINLRFPDGAQVHWRELLNLGTSDGMKSELVRAAALADQGGGQDQEGDGANAN